MKKFVLNTTENKIDFFTISHKKKVIKLNTKTLKYVFTFSPHIINMLASF
jgi:hypothetical protein